MQDYKGRYYSSTFGPYRPSFVYLYFLHFIVTIICIPRDIPEILFRAL